MKSATLSFAMPMPASKCQTTPSIGASGLSIERCWGNPLGLEEHRIVVFSEPSVQRTLRLSTAPQTFEQLRDWLPQQRSMLNPDAPIEGVVWHLEAGMGMAKLKVADFK